MRPIPAALALALAALAAPAAEQDALDISSNIQARHVPWGTILDPVLAGAEIAGYTRCGDSAIWTGHYLAAEAFRFKVTRSDEALANAASAVRGLKLLADATGDDALARCAYPADSPYAAGLSSEEAGNGVHTATLDGRDWLWIGNTSRDQYLGVFFGLAVAWDMIDDAGVRGGIRALSGRLLRYLLDRAWGPAWFAIRPDEQLTLLQIGRHIDPQAFSGAYKSARAALAYTTVAPVAAETLDPHDSYFKFNLDTIGLYNLLRLEDSGFYRFWYREAYNVLRRTTDDHGNPHFNMIDRALNGPDDRRDAETRDLLDAWLTRPRTDEWVDWRGAVAACGEDRSCDPLPVGQRVRTDFLWQRSPFLLYGGGEGNIEGAGIDYILPYWMARYYGVL